MQKSFYCRSQWQSLTSALMLVLGFFAYVSTRRAQASDIEFNRDVRPILSRHCIACHGPDEADRQADLRLDTFEGATEDFGGYSALVPGEPDESELILRIETDDEDLRMPPTEHAEALSKEEIKVLKRWIKEGGDYQQHWSFAPISSPRIPINDDVDNRPNHPIDAFVRHRLQQVGIKPNPPAQPRALARRLSLDLTGLPPIGHEQPVREAIDAYLRTLDAASYRLVVQELLKSKAYGEHWAAMWLDIARYADTVGYAGDENRDIWPWRDWLIQAIGKHTSYRQLALEMIAGDLLPDATSDQILATAFHRNTLNNNEGGTDDEEFRTIAVKDRLSTTINAWMGLTVRCAECHSHKYDPISQHEYYGLLDYFNQSADADRRDDSPTMAIPKHDNQATREGWLATIELIDIQVASLNSDRATKLLTHRKALQSRLDATFKVPIMKRLPTNKQRQTFVNLRGNFRSPGEQVEAHFPKTFQINGRSFRNDRLGLTRWMFDPANPLTARVAVNRYWARLMGVGLVETEEDFGTQGTPPSHPKLLDYLAADFQSDWSVERLLETIVTSDTYKQSQAIRESAMKIDPSNRLLWRGPRVRLSAEVVRDQALAVSGLISRKMHGPPVYPPNPIREVANAFKGATVWHESKGEDRYRRAIYTFLKRSSPHPLFSTFDMATREVCNMRRLRTNTPLQSFMTLNDVTFIEAARRVADLMIQQEDLENGLRMGLRRVLFVEPDENQVAVLRELFKDVHKDYQTNPKDAMEMLGLNQGLSAGQDAQSIDHAAMTVVANVILNLDGFLNN
ncbi:MAG: PSD1 and planctomycete cytochrome C domain-containing protein [Planctomycetota bacterium]